MLFFYRDDPHILIGEMKCRLFVVCTFVSVLLFGTPYSRYMYLAAGLIVYAFLGLWSIGSNVAFSQLLYMSCGLVLFLQALHFDSTLIKKYLGILGIVASASILLGYWDIDWYALTSSRGAAYKSGAQFIAGQPAGDQKFFGLLGHTARTAMLPALLAPISGPIGIVLGLAACLKIAAIGSITPLIALVFGVAYRLRVLTLTIILAIGSSFFFKDKIVYELTNGSTDERVSMYARALAGVTSSPLLGYGLGHYDDASRLKHIEDGSPYWRQIHNDWLEGLYSLGLIGFAPIVFVFSRALRRAERGPRGALFSLAILALLWFPIHVIIVSQVAIILLAISQNKGEPKCDHY